MKQLNLKYDPPIQIDVDGYIEEKTIKALYGDRSFSAQISYIGKATKQLDGSWRCLANVDGKLCLVEVKIKENN